MNLDDARARPHVWTIPQITALPRFGPEHHWFYGLVECEGGEGIEIAEIMPGLGWAALDADDVAESWREIAADLAAHRPAFDEERP